MMFAEDVISATVSANAIGRKETTVRQLKKNIMETDYKKKYEDAMARMELCERTGLEKKSDYIFPELRESEDEKIREALIGHCKDLVRMNQDNKGMLSIYEPWIAYLEKQKAKERLDRMAPIYNDKESFESALEKAWKYYNESASRTVDSFEDDYIECVFSKGFREGFLYREKQKEQEHNEGDFTIYHPLKNGKGEYECIPYSFYGSLTSFSEDKDLIDFLRTCFYTEEECNEWIKQQKEQKPAEWSEEDEKRIKQLIYDTEFIKAHYGKRKEELGERFNNALIRDCDEQIDWLKSLLPPKYCENCKLKRSIENWKPSEEQMEALDDSILFDKTVFRKKKLVSLLEDLKKLM